MREIKKQESRGRNLNLKCDGDTSLMGVALKVAISQFETRKKAYENCTPRIRYYAPIIFLVSGGLTYCSESYPRILEQEKTAMTYSKNYIRQNVADNRLVVISVEVGKDCDHTLI